MRPYLFRPRAARICTPTAATAAAAAVPRTTRAAVDSGIRAALVQASSPLGETSPDSFFLPLLPVAVSVALLLAPAAASLRPVASGTTCGAALEFDSTEGGGGKGLSSGGASAGPGAAGAILGVLGAVLEDEAALAGVPDCPRPMTASKKRSSTTADV